MSLLSKIGNKALASWRFNRNIAAVVWSVVCLSLQPRSWPRTVRALLSKQLVFTGIDATRLTVIIGFLAGLSVVAQIQAGLGRVGMSESFGPILVAVLIREAGPLLVNLLVIGRSGTAIATELGNMRVRKEIDVLDAQGIDVTVYLVMPRVLSVGLSVMCLSMIFIAVALFSGYIFGVLMGATPADPEVFARSVFGSVSKRDVVNFIAKTILPGFLIGTICCVEGLSIKGFVTDVPRAATSAVVRSMGAVIVVSALVSVLTYV